MHKRRLAAALSLLITPVIVHAQQASHDSMPHAGTWAAEVFLGNAVSGASVLRFHSPKLALLFGAEFSLSHVGESDGIPQALSGTTTNVAARLGLRSYRGSSTNRLRPVVGGGLRNSYSKTPNVQLWSAGAYGELGAMYFLTPHISLGGTGELQASYGERKQTIFFASGTSQSTKQDVVTASASLMRVMLAVYF